MDGEKFKYAANPHASDEFWLGESIGSIDLPQRAQLDDPLLKPNRLAVMMKRKHWTVKELIQHYDQHFKAPKLSFRLVTAISDGWVEPNSRLWQQLAQLFDVTVDYLRSAPHQELAELAPGIGTRLFYLRSQTGLTANEVAETLGWPLPTVTAFEKETQTPTLAQLWDLAQLFKVPLETLVVQ